MCLLHGLSFRERAERCCPSKIIKNIARRWFACSTKHDHNRYYLLRATLVRSRRIYLIVDPRSNSIRFAAPPSDSPLLHDAPECSWQVRQHKEVQMALMQMSLDRWLSHQTACWKGSGPERKIPPAQWPRSEEHTSELQSLR